MYWKIIQNAETTKEREARPEKHRRLSPPEGVGDFTSNNVVEPTHAPSICHIGLSAGHVPFVSGLADKEIKVISVSSLRNVNDNVVTQSDVPATSNGNRPVTNTETWDGADSVEVLKDYPTVSKSVEVGLAVYDSSSDMNDKFKGHDVESLSTNENSHSVSDRASPAVVPVTGTHKEYNTSLVTQTLAASMVIECADKVGIDIRGKPS